MSSSDNPLVANQVSDTDFPDNFEDFHELFDREYKKLTDAVNSKEGALYLPQELATFQKYYDPGDSLETRNVYRKLIIFGPLPNAATKRVQHNIVFNNVTRLTRLYGAATDPSGIKFIPLPFSSPTLSNNVTLELNATDILITTAANFGNYTEVTVVVEFIKG